MRKSFLPFHKPSIEKEEIKEVVDSLKSGWLTTGPKVKRFEEEFKKFIGAKYALAVNSGTAALHLALAAIGLKEGDEVIVPTMTFTATAEVVTYFKAKPIFVDCEPDTLLIDTNEIEKKITRRTKAIIPVHYGGQACDIDKILEIAKKHKLKVIWDAAHAFPATYKGKLVGQFPDITCFSFYATKTITTGEGGMAVTNNKKYADRIKILSLHGISKDAWKRYSKEGSWRYEVITPGFKYNLTDTATALGLSQLKKCKSFWQKRKKIAGIYDKAFRKLKEIESLNQRGYGVSARHLYVIKLNLEKLAINRNRFIEELKKRNIGASVHYIPLHLHSYWKKKYHLKTKNYPIANEVFKRIISLPIFPDMSKKDINDVISAIKEIILKYRKENGKKII